MYHGALVERGAAAFAILIVTNLREEEERGGLKFTKRLRVST